MNTVTITATPEGNLAFCAPYDATAIMLIKRYIPATDRAWDSANKRWIVTPAYAWALEAVSEDHYGQIVTLPTVRNNTPAAERTGIFKMLYLGRVKDRGNEQSAFGWVDGAWKLIFPESVLRDWFGAEKRPGESATLYSVLAVKPDAAGAEIKTSWRKLIRVWHPDVNRDQDAADQFRAIQSAYEVLSDPAKRGRYDAGLALERSLLAAGPAGGVFNPDVVVATEYRTPLCCGYVMAEGTEKLGRFVVSKIMGWQDITNDRGETLVTSWPEGANQFQERWVKA